MDKICTLLPTVVGRWTALALASACFGLAVPSRGAVVINEIYYDAEPNTSHAEFIEFYNSGPGAADLSGWHFSRGIVFTFAAGTTLAAGQYLVLVENITGYNQRFGPVPPAPAFGVFAGGWSNEGEVLVLVDGAGNEIDRVGYDVEFP